MKSEFGRGYATCLIEFTFHEPRLARDEALYAKMREKEPTLFTEASAAEIWMNGACDHLHDLIRPSSGISRADWDAAQALRDRVQDIGHSWRESSQSTPDECRALLTEARRLLSMTGSTTFDNAFAWDQAHGIEPQKGEWACVEPMKLDPAR